MGWVVNASNDIDAKSQYSTIIPVCIVLTVVSLAVVAMRIWVRLKRGLAPDDWLSILSSVFALVYAILCIVQTRYGLGLPLDLRPEENLVVYTRVNYAGRPFYQLGISFFKIALLISYLRLLHGTHHQRYRLVVHVTIVLVFLAHLGCTFSLLFTCTPVQKSWMPHMQRGSCLKPGPSNEAYASISIISDIVVAALPLPLLLKLNIERAKKLGLVGIFALGLFTTLCSILRFLQIQRLVTGDGNSTMLVVWGVIEFNVGNLVSSLPFILPIFIKKAKQYRSNSGNTSNQNKTRSRNLRVQSGDAYRLSDRGYDMDTGPFAAAASISGKSHNGSEEEILHGNAIMKSVSYAVKVQEEDDKSHK